MCLRCTLTNHNTNWAIQTVDPSFNRLCPCWWNCKLMEHNEKRRTFSMPDLVPIECNFDRTQIDFMNVKWEQVFRCVMLWMKISTFKFILCNWDKCKKKLRFWNYFSFLYSSSYCFVHVSIVMHLNSDDFNVTENN